ncbi:50S ribosomal protein L33 2 [Striga asiatica]|uniref:50S ribosomal protein L33 2 n=1 Tax=Striga asiatica TaxID=4170 RepID=A0A5A7QN88_STRAF|nr:50S ribosomal protein L33 2 [Striga asiatica]
MVSKGFYDMYVLVVLYFHEWRVSVSSSNPAISSNAIKMKDGDNQTQESTRNVNVSQTSNTEKRKERIIIWNHCERKTIQNETRDLLNHLHRFTKKQVLYFTNVNR